MTATSSSARIPASLLAFLTVMAVLIAAGVPAAAQGWEWQNPTPHGQEINDIVMADEYRAAAVCANGYFMQSFNGGVTWETRSLWHKDLAAIAHPSASVLIVLGLDGLILRSTDFGWVWDTLAQQSQLQNQVQPRLAAWGDSTLLALYGDSRLAVTRDQGVTWQPVFFPLQLNENFRSIAMQSRDVWWVGTSRWVYRSDDAGQSWRIDSSYRAPGLQKLVFIDSLYGYQLRGGQLLQTRDGGASWREMNIYGFGTNIGVAAGPALGRAVYCLGVTEYLVNKSSDEGETWNISLTGNAFPDAVPAAISFANDRVGLVAGEGGRILRTESGGAAWSIVHGLGYPGYLTNLEFSGSENGIACGASSTILVTSNGGRRWDEVLPHPDYSFIDVSMLDGGDAYAVARTITDRYAIFHSSDRGRNWAQRGMLPIFHEIFSTVPNSIHAVSRDTLWVGSSDGIAFRSSDAGANWDSLTISTQMQNDYYSGTLIYSFPPSTVIYVSSSALGVSLDAGATWIARPRPNQSTLQAAQFLTPQLGFAIGYRCTVKTTNGGVSWLRLGDVDLALYRVFDELHAVGFTPTLGGSDRSYILETSDGGVTWVNHPLHEKVQWLGWCWTSPNEGWVFGSEGMLRHTDNGGVAFAEGAGVQPGGLRLDVFPSPYAASADGVLSFRFAIPDGDALPVRLEIWSALGQRVAAVLDGVYAPGEHYAAFQPQDGNPRLHGSPSLHGGPRLRAGMYFCRLSAGALQRTRAFVVVR